MRRFVVLALTLAALGAIAAGAAAAKRGWHSIAKQSSSGDHAIAITAGDVDDPTALAVKVRASRHQSVLGNWLVTCPQGRGPDSDKGSFSGAGTVVRHLKLPTANPASCHVTASGMLEGTGRVSVNILAK